MADHWIVSLVKSTYDNGRNSKQDVIPSESVKSASFHSRELPKGITKFVSPITGKVTFRVMAGVVQGKKIRKEFGEDAFDGIENALVCAKQWYEDKRAEIRSDRSAVVNMPDKDRWTYMGALERLTNYPELSLNEVIEMGLKYYREHLVKKTVTVEVAVAEFLKFKASGKHPAKASYLSSMGAMLRSFAKEFGPRKLTEIKAQEIEVFLENRDLSPVSWNNWRRDLRTMFNFARSERNLWIKTNPAESVRLEKIIRDEVTILSIEEAKKVLKKATEFYDRLVPFLVVGMFGGLRRDEAQAMSWEDINWQDSTIKVLNAKAHSKRYRYVHLEPVLRAWLEKYRPESDSGPTCTMRYARRNDLKGLSMKTGINCSENLYRHSFGSYHYAAYENAEKTMLEMGHTNRTTFETYYKRGISKPRALPYWELTPEAVLSA